jgi:hypothetical protein
MSSGQAVGSTSTVVCTADFGAKAATVQAYDCNAGEWLRTGTTTTGVNAECIQCPAIGSGTGASSAAAFKYGTLAGTAAGATRTVVCDSGHHHQNGPGSSHSWSCDANGAWVVNAADACYPVCTAVSALSGNGALAAADVGASGTVACDPTYSLKAGTSGTYDCVMGSWQESTTAAAFDAECIRKDGI